MPIVVVHGGVSGLPRDEIPALAYAAAAGAGDRLDLLVAAVEALEDDPELNAGYGATLNRDGELELDAGIADGPTGRCAGVAGVSVRHPISLARRVLDQTPHVLVAGAGARVLGADLEQLPDTTPEQRARWERARSNGSLTDERFGEPEHVDTVGAVVLDDAGSLAAGSSTGGVFGKLPGRIGDAPIFGAGIYASASAAVCGTGVGEVFMRTLAAARVGRLIEEGLAPQRACERVVAYLASIEDVPAGLIALDADGRYGAAFRGGSLPIAGPGGEFTALRL